MVSRWSACRLSGRPLELPVVSDYLGGLLSKEAVLEWLLTPDNEDYTEDQVRLFGHIKSLKDVVELQNLTENKGAGLSCEVGDEVLGKSSGKFAYLVGCGHVVPRRMLEHTQEVGKCPVCDKGFSSLDVITLNAEGADSEALRARMDQLRQKDLTHSGKPIKGKKRRHTNKSHSSTVKRSKPT